MNGLPYYPRYPRDFLEGTAGMPLELKGTYALILDLIYMMGDRGLPDDPHFISGHLGCSVRKWNTLKKSLLEAGKITVENGIISNKRADKEKIILSKYQDKQRENRSRPNKNKGLQSPRSHHTDTYTDTEEKRDTSVSLKKKKSAKGSRLPNDWRLPMDWGQWAVAQGVDEIAVRREAEKFRDYWTGVSGQKGVKLDWQATWRNWIRKWQDDNRKRQPKQSDFSGAFGRIKEAC